MHKLYNRIYIRDTWVENGRIFTEGSPEVKTFRGELEAQGKWLPYDTILCIHTQRTGGVIKITTQGTVTACNGQEHVMKYIVQHFLIDGQQVVKDYGGIADGDLYISSLVHFAHHFACHHFASKVNK